MSEGTTKREMVLTVGAQSLQDYWRIYLDSQDAMNVAAMEFARNDPLFSQLLAALTPEQLAQQQQLGLANLEKGIRGDWTDYVTKLRLDASGYASMGVPVDTWYRLIAVVHRTIIPHAVKALASEPDRLIGVLQASQELSDGAMAILMETYLEVKQNLLEAQRTLAEQGAQELGEYQETLRRRTAVLEAVIDSMQDGIALCSPEGEYLVLNDAARKVIQGPSAPGQPAQWRPRPDIFTADGETPMPIEQRPMNRALAGETTRDVELVVREAGSEHPMRLLVDGRPVYDGSTLLGGLVNMRDITERARMQDVQKRSEELERQNLMFQEASRLKSEFLANMSHELRTPLNAIIGFSELIRDGIAGEISTQQSEFLDDILHSGRHLLQLINDILDLAKVEAGRLDLHPEALHLPTLAREVAAVLRGTASKKSLSIDVEADPDIEIMRLDPGRVKQVLFNYLSNALKFTPDGGRVTLRIKAEGDHAIRVEVTDTGPGIADQDLARLFRDFEQVQGTSQVREGTGLGLALTRRLVEAMGGSVGVRTRLGEGSTFYAVLPTRLDRGTAVPRVMAYPGASHDARRVLVVEDDPDDQALLVKLLTEQGYAVETAGTAAQAILRCSEVRFDAITLDLVLPDAPGFNVLRTIRQHQRNRTTPVIVVSVAAQERLAMGFPVSGVLPKPVKAATLQAALENAGVSPQADRCVLVVDDEPMSLRLAEACLTELGHRAVCHSDPHAALQWVKSENPSAILLDLLMPTLDGFAFLERLRESPTTAGIPVFIWTVKDLDADEQARLLQHARTRLLDGKRYGSSLIKELEALLPRRPAPTPTKVANG